MYLFNIIKKYGNRHTIAILFIPFNHADLTRNILNGKK